MGVGGDSLSGAGAKESPAPSSVTTLGKTCQRMVNLPSKLPTLANGKDAVAHFSWGEKCSKAGRLAAKLLGRLVEAHQRHAARLEEEHRQPRLPSQAVTRSHDATWHLGSGSFGDVWLVESRDSGEQLACKVLERRRVRLRGGQGMIEQEVAVLQEVQGRHVGVVQLAGVVETQKTVEILTELCAGGSLKDQIRDSGRIPEASARVLFRQLASALAFLHGRGIVHRDIKPDNVLLSSPLKLGGGAADVIAKLADFGSSVKLMPGETARGNYGTKPFAAPEMAWGLEYDSGVDVWSLGLVLYCLLTGNLPGHSARKGRPRGPGAEAGRAWDSLWEHLADCGSDLPRLDLGMVSWDAQDLLGGMLKLDPVERMAAAGVVAHPWVAGDLGPVEARENRCAPLAHLVVSGKETTLEPTHRLADARQWKESKPGTASPSTDVILEFGPTVVQS